MKISFVVPAYNEASTIGDCLTAIIKEVKRTGYEAEIIVANNASTDNTRQVAESFPGVKVVDEPHKGIVWARRAGFLASSGDLIANIDSDNRVTSGWLTKVIDEFSSNPKLVALSGPFVFYDTPKYLNVLARIFYWLILPGHILIHYILHIGSVLQGGNFVVTRRAMEQIGGYDTKIDFYGEDADLGRRLNYAGRVKFSFQLPISASGRRHMKEGIIKTQLVYLLNFFTIIFLKKPVTMSSTDVRVKK